MVGAKGDAETCALDPAIDTGHVRLLTGTRVRQVLTDEAETRVVGLEAEGPDGRVRIGGDRFVLAAGAVNSAALLLASATERHPEGIANGSGQVGRNLMMHDNAHLAAVDVRRHNDVTFQKTLSVNDWYLDGGDGYPLGSMQLIGKVQGVMMKSWATRWPQAILDQVAARSVECLVMAEDLPSPDERVTVDTAGRIRTTRAPGRRATHRKLHARVSRLLRDAGYQLIATQPFDISMNSHQCGTVRCGTDPATSVLDPWCRSHDLANLWVIDGGFFPSSAAMNPALTIAAQALRVVAESELATG
jgi:choline dehydrogenase-like flavoprotein